jgi:hypothetical protein
MTEERDAEQRAATTSLGELLSEVSQDLSTLFRQEIQLAKAELKESATNAGKGAGMMGGAAYAALTAVLFLSFAGMFALGSLLHSDAWGALIIFAVWAVIGLILFVIGRSSFKAVRGAPQTVETVKEVPDTIKRSAQQ